MGSWAKPVELSPTFLVFVAYWCVRFFALGNIWPVLDFLVLLLVLYFEHGTTYPGNLVVEFALLLIGQMDFLIVAIFGAAVLTGVGFSKGVFSPMYEVIHDRTKKKRAEEQARKKEEECEKKKTEIVNDLVVRFFQALGDLIFTMYISFLVGSAVALISFFVYIGLTKNVPLTRGLELLIRLIIQLPIAVLLIRLLENKK
jgi:hypothetical protein